MSFPLDAEDTYILDATDEAGIDMPYSCRSGTCSSCAGKIVSGTVDQSESQFLTEEKLAEGYALLCVSAGLLHTCLDPFCPNCL